MHYDIRLGFLAADAMSEFSKATATKKKERYANFLERSAEYFKAVRTTYGRPAEADIKTNVPSHVAEFMRAIVSTQRVPPGLNAKLEAVTSHERLVQAIRDERRQPSDDECLKIAKAIYKTSAADLA
jgi:hypothetical protein